MGGKGSGRKCKSILREETAHILAETSPQAAIYLQDVARNKIKGNTHRIDVCKYIINQDLGMPRQKAEIRTDGKLEIDVKWDGNRNSTQIQASSAPETPSSTPS